MQQEFRRSAFHNYYLKATEIIKQVEMAVVGKNEVIEQALMAILAKGHILLEDVPGVGKTTLALAFSKALALDYKRLQFTPDVLPSDVVGFSMYNRQTGEFEFRPGAALCNLFLADEINRTSSKTQSALLELMEEGRVTVDGVTRELPSPYIVIATQNPVGSIGTQMLPESQLDRFMVRLSMGYPGRQNELQILKDRRTENPLDRVRRVVDAGDICRLQKKVEQIEVRDEIYGYLLSLVEATRSNPMIRLGVSPRGALAAMRMARAHAFLRNRDYVVPQDIIQTFPAVAAHRILVSPAARAGNTTPEEITLQILRQAPVPDITG